MQKINTLIVAMLIFGSCTVSANFSEQDLKDWKARIDNCNKRNDLEKHIDCFIPDTDEDYAQWEKITKSVAVKTEYLNYINETIADHNQLGKTAKTPAERARHAQLATALEKAREHVENNTHNPYNFPLQARTASIIGLTAAMHIGITNLAILTTAAAATLYLKAKVNSYRS